MIRKGFSGIQRTYMLLKIQKDASDRKKRTGYIFVAVDCVDTAELYKLF